MACLLMQPPHKPICPCKLYCKMLFVNSAAGKKWRMWQFHLRESIDLWKSWRNVDQWCVVMGESNVNWSIITKFSLRFGIPFNGVPLLNQIRTLGSCYNYKWKNSYYLFFLKILEMVKFCKPNSQMPCYRTCMFG